MNKPKRNPFQPFIGREAYHDALNWAKALAEGREQENEEPEELRFEHD